MAKYIAQSIILAPSHKAPQHYESIDIIADNKPKGDYAEISLQEIDKTNVVAWFVRVNKGALLRLASGYFVITKERIKQARGARYTKEKEVFVKKYCKELEDINAKNLSWKHPDSIKIVLLARAEVGYSEGTAPADILHTVVVAYRKHFKKK